MKRFISPLNIVLLLSLLVGGCTTPTPEAIEKEVVVEKEVEVEVTTIVEVEEEVVVEVTPVPFRIWVEFPSEFEETGLDRSAVVAKLQEDFESELSGQFEVQVEEASFVQVFQDSVAAIRKEIGVDDVWQEAHELGLSYMEEERLGEEETLPEDLQSAINAYYDAEVRFEEEIESASNLAGLPPGHVGFFITPADGYGSATLQDERWSKVYVGLLNVDYPDDQAMQLQYIANAAKQGLGRQFGLEYNTNEPSDAMFWMTDGMREMGEHWKRDADPVAFNSNDLEILMDQLLAWAQGGE
jgi:hypothetical protein